MKPLIKYSDNNFFEKDSPTKQNKKKTLISYIPVLLTGVILMFNYIYFDTEKKISETNFYKKTKEFNANEMNYAEYVSSQKENIFTENYVDDAIAYIESIPLQYRIHSYILLHSNLRWKIKNPIEIVNGEIRKQSNKETELLKKHLVNLKQHLIKHTELYSAEDLNTKSFNLKDDFNLNDKDALIFKITNSFPFIDIFNQNAKISKNILNHMTFEATNYNNKNIAIVNHALINTHQILFSSEYEKFKEANFSMYEKYVKEHGLPDKNLYLYIKLREEYQKKFNLSSLETFVFLYGKGFSDEFKEHILGKNYYYNINLTKDKMIDMLKSL